MSIFNKIRIAAKSKRAILRTEKGFPAGDGICNDCRREYYESCI